MQVRTYIQNIFLGYVKRSLNSATYFCVHLSTGIGIETRNIKRMKVTGDEVFAF